MRKKYFWTLILVICCLFNQAFAKRLTLCAATQTYSAIEGIKDSSKIKFNTYYGTTEDIYARIANNQGDCSLVISSDEKTALLLLRSRKAKADYMRLVRAPLILWSNSTLFANGASKLIAKKGLKSLAIPKASLTPVGFSATEIAKLKEFPTDYLKSHLFRADHEYIVYSLVESKNVQAGFLTKPLIMRDGMPQGSYWYIPEDYYSPIYYYLINTSKHESSELKALRALILNENSQRLFKMAGFETL